MQERWLTFAELCMELRLTGPKVRKLIKAGKLVGICFGHRSRLESDWRYLDPSAKYKQALELQESLLSGNERESLLSIPMLSTGEFCAIAGITTSNVYVLLHRGVVKARKVGKYQLFTVLELRRFLLRKQKAKEAGIPLQHMLDWTLERFQELDKETVLESKSDQEMEKALRRIFRQPEPQRSRMLKEFWSRYELAKKVQP